MFVTQLLHWSEQNPRPMPWRGSRDPYAIWVSEVMLQQTQVGTAIPFYERWMARFPTLLSLAQASEQEVLMLWEGLGYYSRARNLQRAARRVVDAFDGNIPADPKSLRALPGIGDYTAAAIASLAFGLDAAAVDGNIRRVLARLFDVTIPADTPAGRKVIQSLADGHLPPGRAADYNQALMDLGATLCTPRNPACAACPLAACCRAYAGGTQEQRPALKPRSTVPHVTVTAAVIQRGAAFLLAQRPPSGLLGGMWEFPGGKQEHGEDLPACLKREIMEELGVAVEVGAPLGVFRHAYTHFRLTLHAFHCTLNGGEPRALAGQAALWVELGELAQYPMGKVDRWIARRLGAEAENG